MQENKTGCWIAIFLSWLEATLTPDYCGNFTSIKLFVLKSSNVMGVIWSSILALWWRGYINNILVLWTGSKEDFSAFLARLNSNDWNLSFTYTTQSRKLSFLDLTLEIGDDLTIHSSLCRKATVCNTLLNANSAHQNFWKQNIPYSQYLRLKRNWACLQRFAAFFQRGTEKNKNKPSSLYSWRDWGVVFTTINLVCTEHCLSQ